MLNIGKLLESKNKLLSSFGPEIISTINRFEDINNLDKKEQYEIEDFFAESAMDIGMGIKKFKSREERKGFRYRVIQPDMVRSVGERQQV